MKRFKVVGKNRFILFFYVFFHLFTSCNSYNKEEVPKLNIEQVIEFTDSFNVIYLNNHHDQSVTFQFRFNDLFPLKMTDIIQVIEDRSIRKKTTIEEEAWKYVSQFTFWTNPLTAESWQHNPILFLNSIGGGFCDDRASVLAEIWKNWFDSVRVVKLNGHVVSEVYSNDKWKMYDADRKVAYLNADNEVCSVAELEDSSQFVSNPYKKSVIGINPIFKTNNPISERYAKLYASKEDNLDETTWHLNSKEPASSFILPAYSSLKISVTNKDHVNLSVLLIEESKGDLQIPFVPYSAKGTFEYQIGDKSHLVKDSLTYFSTEELINSFDIRNVKSESEIRYLVNPKLRFLQKENSLKVKSSLPIEIIKEKNDVSSYLPEGIAISYYISENTLKYTEFLTRLSKYEGALEEDDLIEQYQFFLSLDKTLSQKQKQEFLILFKEDWQDFKLNNNGFTILKKTYPLGVFYFFIASKYQKIDLMKAFLNVNYG